MSVILTSTTITGGAELDTALAAYRKGDMPTATAAFVRVLAVEPNNPTALFNLGMCFYREARHHDALPYFDRVIGLRPEMPEPWFRHAACAMIDQDHLTALRGYQRALALAPQVAQYHHGYATLMVLLGHVDAALEHFRCAQALKPGYAWAEFSEGLTLIGSGHWLQGWPLMEARRRIGVVGTPLPDRKQWQGEPLNGESILLRTEQGLGDMIHMARYVPAVQTRGGHVVLEVRKELVRLFASVGADEIVQAGMKLPDTDWQDSLMSMPLRFGTTPESEPWDGPYLAPHASDVAVWQQRLAHLPRPRVGICWTGGQVPWPEPSSLAINPRRSLTPFQLSPLLDTGKVSWVAVQPSCACPDGVYETRGLLNDMADTAALIACLDLVITVDTAVVHLAGAMGCPVWLLDRFDHCWRWLPDREDSPWYPSLRIFREKTIGDWQPVIERACAALAAFHSQATANPPPAHTTSTTDDQAHPEPTETTLGSPPSLAQ